jgi:hypothetical protein
VNAKADIPEGGLTCEGHDQIGDALARDSGTGIAESFALERGAIGDLVAIVQPGGANDGIV